MTSLQEINHEYAYKWDILSQSKDFLEQQLVMMEQQVVTPLSLTRDNSVTSIPPMDGSTVGSPVIKFDSKLPGFATTAKCEELEARVAELEHEVGQAKMANTQWTEYANGLAEAKTALEAELAALEAELAALKE